MLGQLEWLTYPCGILGSSDWFRSRLLVRRDVSRHIGGLHRRRWRIKARTLGRRTRLVIQGADLASRSVVV